MVETRQKVLVCGATGFIGRNIAEQLSNFQGFDVHAVYNNRPAWDNSNLTFVMADLTKAEDVDRVVRGMDIVIHAAATTSGSKDISERPYIHVTDNAVMNSYLFRACHNHKVKHVVAFSCSIMYQSAKENMREEDFDEADELQPQYFGAGWTKVYMEKMAEFYSRLGRAKYTVIRHSNIYGPHDKFDLEHSHVFGATMTKVMSCSTGEISVWGTGEEARDLLHVNDLVTCVKLALARQQTPFELVNVGSGKPVKIKDLVRRIIVASGKNINIILDDSGPTIPTSLGLDCRKAKALFGWEPTINLDEGIAMTRDWWLANISDPVASMPSTQNGSSGFPVGCPAHELTG